MSETSFTLSWNPSTDNSAVAGYGAYFASTRVAQIATTSFTFTGLTCGTSYSVGVDAYDAAGNRSGIATFVAGTASCPDTEPPNVPANQRTTGSTETTITMVWDATTDNAGVSGYEAWLGEVKTGTTTQTTYTYTGLTCGTAYTVGLVAFDAAGNRSNRALASGPASTSACAAPQPSPPPTSPPPPASGGTPSVFVASTGNDSSPCTQAAPCRTFQRGYAVAGSGAIVEVAGGTYPSQNIRAVAGKTGPNVVFQEAQGARVILQGLSFGGNDASEGPGYITVRGMETTYKGTAPGARNQEGIHVGPGSRYITLEYMDAGSVSSWFADHLTVKGGDFGPCDAIDDNVCSNNKQDVSTNVLIDGAVFHDLNYDPSNIGAHWECMYLNGSRNTTIRNSIFRGCAIFDLFVTISGPDAQQLGHENLTVENNWFEKPWTEAGQNRSTAVSVAWCQNAPQPAYRNVTIRNNSFQSGSGIQKDDNAQGAGCQFQNVRVIGNIASYQGCTPGWTFSYNLFAGGTCSSSDSTITSFPYVNGATGSNTDFHLGPASAADGFVPSGAGCASADIDGTSRLSGSSCDAGSDEH